MNEQEEEGLSGDFRRRSLSLFPLLLPVIPHITSEKPLAMRSLKDSGLLLRGYGAVEETKKPAWLYERTF